LIAAVLFDWNGTLSNFEWDDDLLAEGHRTALAAIGRVEDPDDFTRRYRDVVLPRVGEPYAHLLRELLGELTDDEAARFIDAEHEVWRPARHVLASARALLESLRGRGLRTGLVADSWPDPAWVLRADVADAGLADVLDTIVFSDDVGARKPDPRIFLQASANLEIDAASTMFVGDRRDKDVQGAAGVGMTTVQAMWFHADESSSRTEPDFTAFTPMDVLNAVRRLA
jgi:HAD superfamily hydrolase (TIGR01509 family)